MISAIRLHQFFIPLPLVVVLIACAPQHCDWGASEAAGRLAALAGAALSPPAESTPACRLAWQQGWQHGKMEFCTPKRGWLDGQSGETVAQICAADTNRPMSYLAAYRLAVAIAQLEAEQRSLTAADEKNDDKTAAKPGSDAGALHAVDLERQLSDLRALAEQHGWLEPEPLEESLKALRKDNAQ